MASAPPSPLSVNPNHNYFQDAMSAVKLAAAADDTYKFDPTDAGLLREAIDLYCKAEQLLLCATDDRATKVPARVKSALKPKLETVTKRRAVLGALMHQLSQAKPAVAKPAAAAAKTLRRRSLENVEGLLVAAQGLVVAAPVAEAQAPPRVRACPLQHRARYTPELICSGAGFEFLRGLGQHTPTSTAVRP